MKKANIAIEYNEMGFPIIENWENLNFLLVWKILMNFISREIKMDFFY